MRYPQNFIDDLRRQADIVRVVKDYVSLKKTGANWVAPCPFHKETKPSFLAHLKRCSLLWLSQGRISLYFCNEIERVTFPRPSKSSPKSPASTTKLVDDGRFETASASLIRLSS